MKRTERESRLPFCGSANPLRHFPSCLGTAASSPSGVGHRTRASRLHVPAGPCPSWTLRLHEHDRTASRANSSPLNSSPLNSSPLNSTPLNSTPLHTPLNSLLQSSVLLPLNSSPLSFSTSVPPRPALFSPPRWYTRQSGDDTATPPPFLSSRKGGLSGPSQPRGKGKRAGNPRVPL